MPLRGIMWSGRSARPDPAEPGAGAGRLPGAGRFAGESSVVHHVGDEAADVRVHAPGDVEEDAAVGREGMHAVTEEMLERAHAGPVGVDGLCDLGELLGVTEQDDAAGGDGGGKGVGEPELAGFVDDEHVDGIRTHRGAGEQPRRSGDDVVVTGGALVVVLDVVDSVDWPVGGLADRAQRASFLGEPVDDADIRLSMAWWLMAVTPTRLPWLTRVWMTWAPVKVFPVPGGPWTGR